MKLRLLSPIRLARATIRLARVKKARATIDWDGLAKLLGSDEARKEFATLRRTFDEVNQALETKFSQDPEPIDWEPYRKGIGSRIVDMYKEAYDNMYYTS
ncbi:unnamed protein product [Rhodiola kirilowii]